MAEYVIENYQINPVTGLFTRVASLITMSRGIEYFKRLNGAGQATFSFDIHDPILDPDIFKLYRNNFLIKRNGGPAWLGPLTGYDTNMASNVGSADIQATEYLYHLNARQTAQNYQKINTAAGAVAWDLINTAQSKTNGNLGIVQGGIETVANINETLEYKNVDEALMNESDNIGGYDFWLEPTMDSHNLLSSVRFNVAKSRSRTIVDKKITADQILNISTSTKRELFNATMGLAYGTGDSVLTKLVEDSGSELGYTRRETVSKFADYRIQANLNTAVQNLNDSTKAQVNTVNITFNPDSKFGYDDIELGDIIAIDTRSSDFPPLLRMLGTVRIIEINVRVDQNGVEFITPKVQFI